MKRVLNLIIILSTLFYSIYSVLNYSNQPYESIHADTTALEIKSEHSESTEMFLDDLLVICENVKCDIFYETIENTSSYHPTYLIYKTNINSDFLDLSFVTRTNCILEDGEYVSTDYSDENAADTIIGINLLQDIKIKSIQNATDKTLNSSVFYADSERVNSLITELTKNGFQVSILSYSGIESQNSWVFSVVISYIILFVAILLYYFSIRKEVVIKKLNGYTSFMIYVEKLRGIFLITVFAIVCEILFVVLIYFRDFKSALNFMQYASCKSVYQVLAVLICATISSCYILMQSDAVDIVGRGNNKGIQVVSLIAKVIVVGVIIVYTSGGIQTISTYISLSNQMNNYNLQMQDWYSIPYNALSIDINGNMDEINQKSIDLFDYFSENFDEDEILIVDMGEYSDNSDTESCNVILANRTYLSMNNINDVSGAKITADEKDDDAALILVPENINSIVDGNSILNSFLEGIEKVEPNISIVYYASEAQFKTFNIYAGDKDGYVYNAIVFVPSNSYLRTYAMDWFSNGDYLLYDSTGNLQNLAEDAVKSVGLQDIIIEINSITDSWESEIFIQKVQAVKDGITIILCCISFLITSIFYVSVYMNNMRMHIALKKLNGYGMLVYSDYYIQIILIIALCYALNLLTTVPVYLPILIFLVDSLCLYMADWHMGNETLKKY